MEMRQEYPGGPNAITITFNGVPDGDYYAEAFLDNADSGETDVLDVGEAVGGYPDDGSVFTLYSDYETPFIQMEVYAPSP